MKDLKAKISQYSHKDLEARKNWYSPAAEAYNKVRPRYSKDIIDRVIQLAKLPKKAKILEIGSGPGIATIEFAQLGFSMVCLEPNQDFYLLAKMNCQDYPNVTIQNISFEEWQLEPDSFNAILAATSIHWISPEIAYPKAADALQDNGSLILLWNNKLEPDYEVYQLLQQVYQEFAPSVAGYENRETQAENLRAFGEILMDSGRFKNLVYEQAVCEVNYSVDDYLTLLSTYSKYIELDPERRNSLFKGLKEKIEENFGKRLSLSYLCAFHIAQKS